MAGHSKWANIKHRKERQDNKRGKIFTKLIRELTVAAKQGGIPADNPRLRLAVDKALAANMTRDTIDRAIARGVGGADGDNVEELVYEGYAPNGVAVFVETMTDNRNRTAAEIRHAFNKYGGNLGTDGSVAYLFERKGQICYAPGVDAEALMDAALELGADDILTNDDGSVEVLTTFADFITLNKIPLNNYTADLRSDLSNFERYGPARKLTFNINGRGFQSNNPNFGFSGDVFF